LFCIPSIHKTFRLNIAKIIITQKNIEKSINSIHLDFKTTLFDFIDLL
jgi:hypothetical protein